MTIGNKNYIDIIEERAHLLPDEEKVEQLKTSNQELEKKRQEIQAVLDGITDLMVVLSEDLWIQQVNHVFSGGEPSATKFS